MINYKFKCLRQDLQAFYWEFDQIWYEDQDISILIKEKITLSKSVKILLTGISINGYVEGYTKLVYADTNTLYFAGEFFRNLVHQQSTKTYYPNKQIEYQGDIIFGFREGYARIFWPNGCLKIDGEFHNDLFHGRNIKFYHENKNIKYQGDFSDGKKENYGKWYNKKGVLVCEGGIRSDKVDGKDVKFYYNCGALKFKGGVIKGRKSGEGAYYYRNGIVRYEGLWQGDKPVNGPDGGIKIFQEDGSLEYEGPVLANYIMN